MKYIKKYNIEYKEDITDIDKNKIKYCLVELFDDKFNLKGIDRSYNYNYNQEFTPVKNIDISLFKSVEEYDIPDGRYRINIKFNMRDGFSSKLMSNNVKTELNDRDINLIELVEDAINKIINSIKGYKNAIADIYITNLTPQKEFDDITLDYLEISKDVTFQLNKTNIKITLS
jgi:galactitol-specific phosphotransferase system IIB component